MGSTSPTGDKPWHPFFQCSGLQKSPKLDSSRPSVSQHSTRGLCSCSSSIPGSPFLQLHARWWVHGPLWGQSTQDEGISWAEHTFPLPLQLLKTHKVIFLGRKTASSPLQRPTSGTSSQVLPWPRRVPRHRAPTRALAREFPV